MKNPRSPINSRNSINLITDRILLFTVYCLLLTVLCGCAPLLQKDTVLAVVDGEPITEDNLKYFLSVAHRREELLSAGAFDLLQFVRKLVDDQLIINEARYAGMEQYPEVQQAVEAYVLRESVLRLHDEEIVQKVSVSDKEIGDYYKENYEKFTLGIIELESEEKANEVLELLRKGGSFKELVQRYSSDSLKKKDGEFNLTRNSLPPDIGKVVSSLMPDELSGSIKISDRYFIVKLIKRKEAPDDELKKFRNRIEKDIRKHKEKERSDEYLKYLRGKASIKIDRELLSSIKLNGGSGDAEEKSNNKKPLVELDGTVLTVGDFVKMIAPSVKRTKESIIDNWIDHKIIDHEAIGRRYEAKPDLKKMVYCYENQILKDTFIKRIIIPQIAVTDKNLEEYYSQHQENFLKPVRYKVQQITVETIDEAQEILRNLKNGADFSWLAKRKSADSALSRRGEARWFTKEELPTPVREIIDTLQVGDVSPVIGNDSSYGIIRLQEKTVKEVEAFGKVKGAVYKAYIYEQVNALLDKYVDRLKTDARIKIYENEIQSIEKKFKQQVYFPRSIHSKC